VPSRHELGSRNLPKLSGFRFKRAPEANSDLLSLGSRFPVKNKRKGLSFLDSIKTEQILTEEKGK
jgi:hypothetical protein